jgi:hypothetical protein
MPLLVQTRGIGSPEHPIPAEVRAVAARIEVLPGAVPIDQLTVNEYAPGVGISPHVGEEAQWPVASQPGLLSTINMASTSHDHHKFLHFHRRNALCLCWGHRIPESGRPGCGNLEAGGLPAALALPAAAIAAAARGWGSQQLLCAEASTPACCTPWLPGLCLCSIHLTSWCLLAGAARYCWQHYIPHRKSDLVAAAEPGGPPEQIPRAQRRVSFTFRQVRALPCCVA